MKSSLSEADKHNEDVTYWDQYRACVKTFLKKIKISPTQTV